MRPNDLIAVARALVPQGPGRPRQAFLRRAISTAYYALFHALARAGAESLVGSQKAVHGDEAWVRVCCALDHKQAKQACTDRQALRPFP